MSNPSACRAAEPFFPLPDGSLFCKVIPGFLSREECDRLIAESEARGYAGADSDYPPSYRNNDRQVLDCPDLASRMFARLQGLVPASMPLAETAPSALPWTLDSINERFRLCRYRPGQVFHMHQDGVHHRSRSQQSCLTFLVYLSDGASCEGGDTQFYEAGHAGDGEPIATVTPQAGSLIVFDHRLWHAGARVASGTKYILRSDVIYRAPDGPCQAAPATFESGHQGYVWTLERLSDEIFASGGRDTSIRVWHRDGSLLQTLNGHTQSVLGLARLSDRCLASVSRDRALRVWDWQSGRCLHVVEAAHAATLLSVVALDDGTIATAGADGRIKLWDVNGNARGVLEGHDGWVWGVDKLPQGRLASASEDGDVRIWHPASGACLQVLPGAVALRSLAVSEGGRHIATAGIDGSLAVWERRGDAWTKQRSFAAHRAAARRVRWLSATLLASAGEDNQTRLWAMPDRTQLCAESSRNFTTDVMAMGKGILSCSYDGQLRWLKNGAAAL
ncbi:2OG-Fe(II) oxygenase [Achromobacter marplatensis]|uniref:2OG-Fe(II) oxygenase n=1 Tax=Achromobacter marplatensis TaxID=470868 RepID=UPI0039F7330A